MGIYRVPEQFGTALRAARLIRGLTQVQVAAATGVPAWRLRSLERGQGIPHPVEFTAIWNFLTTEDDPPSSEAKG